MPNTNTKLVDSKTIAALFELTPRRIQQLTTSLPLRGGAAVHARFFCQRTCSRGCGSLGFAGKGRKMYTIPCPAASHSGIIRKNKGR